MQQPVLSTGSAPIRREPFGEGTPSGQGESGNGESERCREKGESGGGSAAYPGGPRTSGSRGVGRGESKKINGRGAAGRGEGLTLHSGAAAAQGFPGASARTSGKATCPRTFLCDTRADGTCVTCLAVLQRRHRVVRLPRENGHHVLHARGVVEAPTRGAAQAPLGCPAACSKVRHTRRDAC